MKPILFAITFLIFSLSTSTIQQTNYSETQGIHFNVTQDQIYMHQNINFRSAIINGFGCIDCHGNMDMSPTAMTEMLKKLTYNFDGDIVVHQEESPQFIEGLKLFLESNDKIHAWKKYVNIQKIETILEDQ